ncbi:MAG TPA: hypothetical protein VE088_08930 [Gaiellaceae bacterium]|jgi:hypothetical protein|nr:hypothetical protein [Gaiellaceae bacterium]
MWDWAIWAALIAGGLAVVAALVFLVVRILEAWRAFTRIRGHLSDAAEGLTAQGEAVADRAAGALDTSRVAASLMRLRTSLAQLAVLREAVDEVQDTLGRLATVMPRK